MPLVDSDTRSGRRPQACYVKTGQPSAALCSRLLHVLRQAASIILKICILHNMFGMLGRHVPPASMAQILGAADEHAPCCYQTPTNQMMTYL
jgi:hypothetical protein